MYVAKHANDSHVKHHHFSTKDKPQKEEKHQNRFVHQTIFTKNRLMHKTLFVQNRFSSQTIFTENRLTRKTFFISLHPKGNRKNRDLWKL